MPAPRVASAKRGATLLERHGCLACHATTTDAYWGGPSLWQYWGSRIELEDGTAVVVDVEHLRESLFDPDAKIAADASPGMASYTGRLDDDDIADIAAYLESLAAP